MGMMEGYVDVAERIRQLREKHPEAVLRPANPAEPFRLMVIGDREFVVYTAACYRHPEDPLPAIAVAAEPSIGKTNFTRDSEVMNAETSAWGRAIIACLAADSQKIASADEVRNRMKEEAPRPAPKASAPSIAQPAESPAPSGEFVPITDKQAGLIRKLSKDHSLGEEQLRIEIDSAIGKRIESIKSLSKKEGSRVIEHLMALPIAAEPEEAF